MVPPPERTTFTCSDGVVAFPSSFAPHSVVMSLTHQLELFPDHKVTQILFRDVKNAAELRQNAMAGKISGALLNATMVRSCIFIEFRQTSLQCINFNCVVVYVGAHRW